MWKLFLAFIESFVLKLTNFHNESIYNIVAYVHTYICSCRVAIFAHAKICTILKCKKTKKNCSCLKYKVRSLSNRAGTASRFFFIRFHIFLIIYFHVASTLSKFRISDSSFMMSTVIQVVNIWVLLANFKICILRQPLDYHRKSWDYVPIQKLS